MPRVELCTKIPFHYFAKVALCMFKAIRLPNPEMSSHCLTNAMKASNMTNSICFYDQWCYDSAKNGGLKYRKVKYRYCKNGATNHYWLIGYQKKTSFH